MSSPASSGSEPRQSAVIDLGSNSFRLVVFTAEPGAWWKRTDEIYEAVRVGEGLAETGRLGKKPIRRALEVLELMAQFLRASGIPPEAVDAVATSAIRDAENRDDLLGPAREATGLAIRVLDWEEEARYGYLAAVNSTTLEEGAVLDLGGGSLQLVGVSGRRMTDAASWPLGAVRMTERFLPDPDDPTRKQMKALRAHVAEELARAEWLPSSGDRLIGIGGTVRNLAAAVQAEEGLPSIGVQGFLLEAEALDELIELLADLSAAERGRLTGIKPERGDLILAGALVVREVLATGGFDAIETIESGLREGVFFETHLAGVDEGPMFGDVRRQSVVNLAMQHHADVSHARHVARLALRIYDDLVELDVLENDPAEREILWASALLHDVGVAVDYDDHHKHSRYLILSGGLPGWTPRELVLIAQNARYHRKGTPGLGPFADLAEDGDAALLERGAALLRLAESLERSRDQIVHAAHVVSDGDGLQLEVVTEPETEAAVERWVAARHVGQFERAFGRPLTVR